MPADKNDGNDHSIPDKNEYQRKIFTSANPFIVPEYQKIKNIQMDERSKYELRLNCAPGESLACASYSYHGVSFSKPFKGMGYSTKFTSIIWP